jgi:predicted small metal-binding protein
VGLDFPGSCPPAPLSPHHALQRWFQCFDNLLAKVVTRPWPDNRQQTGQPVASQVICECGYVMRDDDEDRVVALVRDHIRTDHPEMLHMATPEMIRTWIEITP